MTSFDTNIWLFGFLALVGVYNVRWISIREVHSLQFQARYINNNGIQKTNKMRSGNDMMVQSMNQVNNVERTRVKQTSIYLSHEEMILESTKDLDGIRDLTIEDKNKPYSFSPTSRTAYIAKVIFETALPLLSSLIQTSVSPSIESDLSSFTSTFTTNDTNSSIHTSYVQSSKWDTFWSRKTKIKTKNEKNSNIELHDFVQNSDLVSNALEELGPTFVKFGQAAASRPDLIPPPLATSFSKLQDRMTPFDTDIAKEIIQSDLNNKMRNNDVRIINNDKENVTATYPKISENLISSLLDSLTNEPVAAAR